MTPADYLLTAYQMLTTNRARSLLTILSVAIGIAAVTTIVAVTLGAETRIRELSNRIEAGLLTISSTGAGFQRTGGTFRRWRIDHSDYEAVSHELRAKAIVVPVINGHATMVVGNRSQAGPVIGTINDYTSIHPIELKVGRIFNDADLRAAAKVVVIGESLAAKLFPGWNPVGRLIRINRMPLEVIGVVRSDVSSLDGSDPNLFALLPITAARQRVFGRDVGGRRVDTILVEPVSSELASSVRESVRDVLRHKRRLEPDEPDSFFITDISANIDRYLESLRVRGLLLAGLAAISLITAGFGVMTLMLVSVNERISEIGLRMAIGASTRQVALQFLIEAVLLAVAGGLAGGALGIAISQLAPTLFGWPVAFDPRVLIVAMLLALLVGSLFGAYPAYRASRLEPIEALRRA